MRRASKLKNLFQRGSWNKASTIGRLIVPVTIPKSIRFTPEEFWAICQANPNAVLELSSQGELLEMTPASTKTGYRKNLLAYRITAWAEGGGGGSVFNSSAGFRLADSSVRSPDVNWLAAGRWEALSTTERQGFAAICPDFVVELVSPTPQR